MAYPRLASIHIPISLKVRFIENVFCAYFPKFAQSQIHRKLREPILSQEVSLSNLYIVNARLQTLKRLAHEFQ